MMLQPLQCCETVHLTMKMQTLIKSGIYRIKSKGMRVKSDKASRKMSVNWELAELDFPAPILEFQQA